MNTLKNIVCGFFLLGVFWLLGLGTGYCQTTYTITQEQYNILEQTFNVLEKNNNELQERLTTQQTELNNLKEQLNNSNNSTNELKNQLQESRTALAKAKESSTITENKLVSAEEYLNKLEKQNKNKDRKIKFMQYALIGSAAYILAHK